MHAQAHTYTHLSNKNLGEQNDIMQWKSIFSNIVLVNLKSNSQSEKFLNTSFNIRTKYKNTQNRKTATLITRYTQFVSHTTKDTLSCHRCLPICHE